MTGEKRPRLESVVSPPDALRVFTHGSISAELVRLVESEVGDDADVWSLVDEIRVRLNTLASELSEIDEVCLEDLTDLDDLTRLGVDIGNFRMPDPETLWHGVATIVRDKRRPRSSVDVADAPSLAFVLAGLTRRLGEAWKKRVSLELARLDLELVDDSFSLPWTTEIAVEKLDDGLRDALREFEYGSLSCRRSRLARFLLVLRDLDFACLEVDRPFARACERLASIVEKRRRLESEFGFSPIDRRAAVERRLLDLPNGASGDASVAYVEENAIDVSDEEFEALWDVGEKVPPTPNPMNPKHHLLRKQATFGASYAFGGQRSANIGGDDLATWPAAVKKMLDAAKTSLGGKKFEGHDLVVHLNWYPGGRAGVEPHADDENDFVPDAPILGFTLYRSGLDDWLRNRDHVPRKFQIYAKDPAAKRNVGALVHDVPLPDESLVVMAGATQRDFLHGVRKTGAKEFGMSRRISGTVRVLNK